MKKLLFLIGEEPGQFNIFTSCSAFYGLGLQAIYRATLCMMLGIND